MATFTTTSTGRHKVQIRNVGFKHVSQTFDKHADAVAWARRIEAQQQAGEVVDVRTQRATSVRDLFARFLREEVPHRKGARWETVRINMLLEADFTHRRLDQDVPEALRMWVKRRLREVSAATVRRDLALISGIFSHAIKVWGLPLPVNPVSRIQRPASETKSIAKHWTAEDLDKMRQAYARFRDSQPRRELKHTASFEWILPALELSVETAMRRGELCSVLVSDIDTSRRTARLRDTKNGEGRDVMLSARAVEIINGLLAMPRKPGEGRLIPVDPETLGLRFRQLRNEAGLEHRLHDGRGTAVTNAAKKLGDPMLLARFSGHKDTRVLLHYFRPSTDETARLLD